jgi:hypothetical protein
MVKVLLKMAGVDFVEMKAMRDSWVYKMKYPSLIVK